MSKNCPTQKNGGGNLGHSQNVTIISKKFYTMCKLSQRLINMPQWQFYFFQILNSRVILGGDVRYKGIAYTFLNGAKQCQIKKYHEKIG